MTLTTPELISSVAAALAALITVALVIARAHRSSSDEAFASARKLGPYRVGPCIGEGGMGIVYEARDVRRREAVALKMIRGTADALRLERFEREIHILESIRHPNVVALYDHGWTQRGARYFVMELVRGTDLERLVREQGAQEPERVVEILVEVCDALAEVHAAGIVHGDIKPANVCLCRGENGFEQVKLLDFGLARDGRSADVSSTSDERVLGSPYYMAPECFTEPSSAGPGADLYAVGVLAYTLLSGKPPFSGTLIHVATQHLSDAPPSLAERSPHPLSDELEALVASCLEKRVEKRPLSARALQSALLACPEARHRPEFRLAA